MLRGMSQSRSRMRIWLGFAFIALLGMMPVHGVSADERPEFPRRQEANALVRATIATLNDANLTGNYAVLRAKSAPAFQDVFTTEKLEDMFKGMREKRVDLSRALAADPEIAGARFHTGKKVLQFTGLIRTLPIETQFVFSYQKVDGAWKLYALDLNFEPAKEPAQAVKDPAI